MPGEISQETAREMLKVLHEADLWLNHQRAPDAEGTRVRLRNVVGRALAELEEPAR